MLTWGRISLLALASAALIAGCGGGDGEIPADDADILEARLNEVEGAMARGDCDGARDSAALLIQQVGDGDESLVPRRVDGEVREALQDAARRLADLVAEQCEEPIENEEPEEPVDPLPPEDENQEDPPEDEAPPEDEDPPEDDGGDAGGDQGRGGGNQGGGPPGGGTAPPSGGTGAG